MNHLIFTLILISLACTSTNAATATIQTEIHFETACINTYGYWTPQDKYNANIDSDEEAPELPTLEAHKDFIADLCKDNKIDELIKFYQEWLSDINHSELLKIIMFPERILDTTPYGLCVEENNATKLAVLLSAVSGNVEGQVLALDILSSLAAGDAAIDMLAATKRSLQMRLSGIDPTNINTDDLLGLSTLHSLDLPGEVVAANLKLCEERGEQLKQNSNARTLLRIADRYLLTNRHDEAMLYLQSAANKGSIRAVLTMASLIANRSENPEMRFVDIESLLGKYQGHLGGYEYLLPAYYYQYGSLGLVQRNLYLANRHYKLAINQNCREATFEYGEFLMSVLNTCSANDARRVEFHKYAILAYEKAGDLGLEFGYTKVLELLSNQDILDQTMQKSIRLKLLRSKIFFQSLDMILENHFSKDESLAKKRARKETFDRETFMSDLMLKIVDISKI